MRFTKLFPKNPKMGYLSNQFEHNVIGICKICHLTPKDILCIDETKLDSSYQNSQFHTAGCQFLPFRGDRNKNRGGAKLSILDKDS